MAVVIDPGLAEAFICRLSSGRSVAAVCRDADMPDRRLVYKWLAADAWFAQRVAAVRAPESRGRAPGGAGRGLYSEALAAGICAALAEGFSLREVCASAQCPVGYGTVQAWVARRPDFAARYRAACAPRQTARGLRIGRGRRGGYDPQFAHLIAERLAEGRSLLSVSRDPDMPGTGVLAEWRARYPAFRAAMGQARRAQLDVLLDEVIQARDAPGRKGGPAHLAAMVMRNGHLPYSTDPVLAGRSWAAAEVDGTRRERADRGGGRERPPAGAALRSGAGERPGGRPAGTGAWHGLDGGVWASRG